MGKHLAVTFVLAATVSGWAPHVAARQSGDLRMLAEQIVPRVRIADDSEFFSLWDLSLPGMEPVQEAVSSRDLDRAKVALKAYFLKRREPAWEVNHWDMPAAHQGTPSDHPRHAEGEAILAHRFSGHGFTVDHGEKIDWDYFPLTKPDGRRDYEYGLTHSINRFFHFTRVLGPLYWFTHDERYAEEFAYEVTDFVLSWPAPEKYWIDAPGPWRQLTSAVPLNGSWLGGYNYFLPSDRFTPEAHAVMLKGFIEKARFAVRNPNAVNRYMLQLSGIHNVGAYFPELKEAADLRAFSERAMEATLDDEFYPDTISKELCPGYHGTSRHAVRRMVDSSLLMGYQPSRVLLGGLESIYDFYPKVATPTWRIPHFGDTQVGCSDMLSRTFADIVDLVDNPVYRWFASSRSEGEPPGFVSTRLPWAGFYVMRSGWDERALYLCLDAGPLGKGHWHEDLLNFECYGFGEPLISEVGVYSYVTDMWSSYFRSSLAHNIVTVDGLGQCRTGSSPLVVDTPRADDWHSDGVFDLAWGVHEGLWSDYLDRRGDHGTEIAVHRRDVCFVKDSYWILSDRLEAEGAHEYAQLFHFRPDRLVEVADSCRAGTVDEGRPNVWLIQADPSLPQVISGQEDPPQGWYSDGQREKTPAPVLSFGQNASGRALYDTIVRPLDTGCSVDIVVERLPVSSAGGAEVDPRDVCALRIRSREGTDYYVNDLRQRAIGPPNGQVKVCGSLETDARAAVVRLGLDGDIVAASAVGSSTLRLDGRDLLAE